MCPEILLHIMKYLDMPSLLQLNATCKLFHNLFEDKCLWGKIRWVEKVMPVRLIDGMKKNSTQIKFIRCNSTKEQDIWSSNFNRMLWSLPNLKAVNFFNCKILFEVNWLRCAPNMSTLILSGCVNMSGQSFVNGVQYLRNLKHLEIMFCGHRVVAYEVVIAVQNCQNLQILNCHETGNMRPWMVVRALRYCTVLSKFYFTSLHHNDTTQERVQWYKIVRCRYPHVTFARQVVEKVEDYEEFDAQVGLVKWIDYLNDNGI